MTVCYGAAGRYLGLLAELLGDWDTAETHFEQALELNQKMLAKPWIAHTRGDFARMLKKRGRPDDIHRADALLNEAWSAAQDLGMVALTNRLRQQQS
jgi:tetratricopeptide (TPR) repeat protein